MHRWTYPEGWSEDGFRSFGENARRFCFRHSGVIHHVITVAPDSLRLDGTGLSAGHPLVINMDSGGGECEAAGKTHHVLVAAVLLISQAFVRGRKMTYTPPNDAVKEDRFNLIHFTFTGELPQDH